MENAAVADAARFGVSGRSPRSILQGLLFRVFDPTGPLPAVEPLADGSLKLDALESIELAPLQLPTARGVCDRVTRGELLRVVLGPRGTETSTRGWQDRSRRTARSQW